MNNTVSIHKIWFIHLSRIKSNRDLGELDREMGESFRLYIQVSHNVSAVSALPNQ